jgi:hypothetical protein
VPHPQPNGVDHCQTVLYHDVACYKPINGVDRVGPLSPARSAMDNASRRTRARPTEPALICRPNRALSRSIPPTTVSAPVGSFKATVFAAVPDGSRVVAVSPDQRELDVWELTANRSRHVPADGPVIGVAGAPRTGRALVLLRAGNDSATLELWDLHAPTPTRKILLVDLAGYDLTQVHRSIGFDRDRIVFAHRGRADTWNGAADQHGTVFGPFAPEVEPLAVAGTTVLSPRGYRGLLRIISLEPPRWRDKPCDVLGRPDRADLPGLPDGIRTTGLCTT